MSSPSENAVPALSLHPNLPTGMPPVPLGSASLTAAVRPATAWLWHGYLAPGAVTLLTSQWKVGKTTLASVLLVKMKTGSQLGGLSLAAGRAVVVSEEGPEHWHRRHQQLDFGDHVGWFCRPFPGKPRPADWLAFLAGLADLHGRLAFALLVIDPLAAFLPGEENHAGSILEALLPLRQLTARGVSVLVQHHPRKGETVAGQAARGSGALSSYADILIEMRTLSKGRPDDRRRRLCAWSRYPETPRRLVLEWSADGKDYLASATVAEEEFARHWQTLSALLAEAPHKLERAEILRRWPGPRPLDKVSLGRWLERAVSQGLLRKDGTGRRNQSFRYWLPEREAHWWQDPLACLRMPELFDLPPFSE